MFDYSGHTHAHTHAHAHIHMHEYTSMYTHALLYDSHGHTDAESFTPA